jgi:hypothetical protein
MPDSNLERWISKRKAAKIVGLGYERTIRFLMGSDVRKREVPLGESRRTIQYWLPDVLNLNIEAKAG